MKLDCEVIRDLLPLYAEQMASPASTELVEEHLQGCEACREQLRQMQMPVPVKPELEPVRPLQEIRKNIDRKQKGTMLAAVVVVLLLAAAVIFGGYAYLVNEPVLLEEAQVVTYYQQSTPGIPGWVLQARGTDVYLKIDLNRKLEGADVVLVPVRYRYTKWHDVVNKVVGFLLPDEKALSKKTQKFLVSGQSVAVMGEDTTVFYQNTCKTKQSESKW